MINFQRDIIKDLESWKRSPTRKPLLLRGARQVGKTTVVNIFAEQYEQYIYLNLEQSGKDLGFTDYGKVNDLLEKIFFLNNKDIGKLNTTLLFIDEIQEVPGALNMLRYFYEEVPNLNVIAAGSLLETAINGQTKIPVGRVEYKVVRPFSFHEFLLAMGETRLADELLKVPARDFTHPKMLQWFNTYVLIGGMPEVIKHYAANRNLLALGDIYQSLLQSYIEDVEKYGRNGNIINIIRHIISNSFLEAGNRIKFQHFGNSNYGSREVGECMQTLQRVMLLHLVYPTTNTHLPIVADKKKSPRLQVLDTGMLNHFAGLQKDLLSGNELDNIYKGKVVEHIVGQELLAARYNILNELHFWVREKANATAEVDFVIPHDGLIIPIEVKSGAAGTLRSLHAFMDATGHDYAIRLYGGPIKTDRVQTLKGKPYTLLSLPYYLAGRMEEYLDWMKNAAKGA